MWCQFMCVHYHLFICQSSLLQLVTQLLFITYFNAPFHCHQGSYLLRAFTFFFIDYLFLFSLWLVSICVFSHLVLLMDGFLSLIFLYTWFFLFVINLMFKRHLIFFCHLKKKNHYVFRCYIVCLLYNSPWMTYRLLLLLIVLILKFLQEMNTKILQCS